MSFSNNKNFIQSILHYYRGLTIPLRCASFVSFKNNYKQITLLLNVLLVFLYFITILLTWYFQTWVQIQFPELFACVSSSPNYTWWAQSWQARYYKHWRYRTSVRRYSPGCSCLWRCSAQPMRLLSVAGSLLDRSWLRVRWARTSVPPCTYSSWKPSLQYLQ